jgi:hypothetical protein
VRNSERLRKKTVVDRHYHQQQLLGIRTSDLFQFRITSEITNRFDIYYKSLDGGSAQCKVCTSTGQQAQKDEDKYPCLERDSSPFFSVSKRLKPTP